MAGQETDVQTVALGDGWINKVGGRQFGPVSWTEAAAVDIGRELARHNRSEHSIHAKDGTIREKFSYGNDPRDISG